MTTSEDLKHIRAEFTALIERFGKGWEEGKSEAMAGVFAEDGVFVPDPFSASLEGREAIREYWGKLPFEQADVKFRFGEIHVAGPWFATEFRCTFRRRRTGEPVDVRGAVFCETRDDTISEMRMYWDRRTGD